VGKLELYLRNTEVSIVKLFKHFQLDLIRGRKLHVGQDQRAEGNLLDKFLELLD
jgi:hypothetical protein